MKIIVVGDSQHGKDTVGRFIEKHSDLKCTASSEVALEIFLFDILSAKYGYKTIQEAYENRHKNRKEWFEAIQKYNKEDKTRLAREVLERGNVYLGMRDPQELQACIEQDVVDWVLGVFDPRKPRETHSKIVDVFEMSDYLIINNQGLEELEQSVIEFLKYIKEFKEKP